MSTDHPDAWGPSLQNLKDIQEELVLVGAQGYREKVGLICCRSSDLAFPLRCLQLPPHTGISRVDWFLEPELLTDAMMEQWKKLPGLPPPHLSSQRLRCHLKVDEPQYDTDEYRRIAAALRRPFPLPSPPM